MSPMLTLEPPNRFRIGLMGLLVVVLVTLVGQSFTSAPMLNATPVYYGQFTDSGQINKGDTVRIAGKSVGHVESLKIDGDHVVVGFNAGTNRIGNESRLAIKTDTVLGRKVLEVESRGSERLRPGAMLPLSQGSTPYQLYDAIFDTTRAASSWGVDTVKESLKVLSSTIGETAPHLSAALDGVARFSDTIGKRDDEVKHLLAQANQVAEVLGDRNDQFDRLLVNAKTLLAAFNQRGQAIDALLGNVAAVSTQVKGLIDDNPNLNHVLEQLRTVSDLLVKRKEDLADGLEQEGRFIIILNETIASGPYFKVQTANSLVPNYQIMQPWLDAAFRKRGILPEEMWRNAGMPAFRYPDPNGIGFANAAPPPSPRLLEGTPEHPGPAVPIAQNPADGPCSYAPAAGDFPTPTNPMPCAGLGGPSPSSDILFSPSNPNGLAGIPGINIAGPPGWIPPTVPGTPVPLPDAPRGARTEPLGPVSGPAPANPGHAWPPMVLGPYPPAPPAPGGASGPPVGQIPPGQGGNSQPGGGGGALEGR